MGVKGMGLVREEERKGGVVAPPTSPIFQTMHRSATE